MLRCIAGHSHAACSGSRRAGGAARACHEGQARKANFYFLRRQHAEALRARSLAEAGI